MSFSKKMAARWVLVLCASAMVAGVAALMLMRGDELPVVSPVSASPGLAPDQHGFSCPFPTEDKYPLIPSARWEEDPVDSGQWYFVLTPRYDSENEFWQMLGDFSFDQPPNLIGTQVFYEFEMLAVFGEDDYETIFDRTSFAADQGDARFLLGDLSFDRDPIGLRYLYWFRVIHDGNVVDLCWRHLDGGSVTLPEGLVDPLSPTATPLPDCNRKPASVEDLEVSVIPHKEGNPQWVSVVWNKFESSIYGEAARYELVIDGSTYRVSRSGSDQYYVKDIWSGDTDTDQMYTVPVTMYGSNGCEWGTKHAEFHFIRSDVLGEDVCSFLEMSAVSWGVWLDPGQVDLSPLVKFSLVEGATSYLVQFGPNRSLNEVTPSEEDLSEGVMTVIGYPPYTAEWHNKYTVLVMPKNGSCVGQPVIVDCRYEDCIKVPLGSTPPELTVPEVPLCSGYTQPAAHVVATVEQSGKHAASVRIVSSDAGATHFDLKTQYRGQGYDTSRVLSADALLKVDMGLYEGPVNTGDYWFLTVQARAVNADAVCAGPWGPISSMRLEAGMTGTSTGTIGPLSTPIPGVVLEPPVVILEPPVVILEPPVVILEPPVVTLLPTVTPPPIRPTPPVSIPGDPVVYPEPVDYWSWKATPESGTKPGHHSWCDNGRYDSKMDDYYARVDEFATTYGQILKDAGVSQVRREVDEAIDEAFEDPEEFCARVGLFGFIRFGLAWLSGVVFSLMALSGLILIIVRSAGGDSPSTQVFVKQVFIGLVSGAVVVAVVWVVFEILINVLFGVGVDVLPYGTTGG